MTRRIARSVRLGLDDETADPVDEQGAPEKLPRYIVHAAREQVAEPDAV
jgi:hypothetical protein